MPLTRKFVFLLFDCAGHIYWGFGASICSLLILANKVFSFAIVDVSNPEPFLTDNID